MSPIFRSILDFTAQKKSSVDNASSLSTFNVQTRHKPPHGSREFLYIYRHVHGDYKILDFEITVYSLVIKVNTERNIKVGYQKTNTAVIIYQQVFMTELLKNLDKR